MPSSSGKQHRFMAAVASNPKFAKKVGVPQSVGDEFLQADKGRKFKESEMKAKMMAGGGMPMVKKGKKMVPAFAADNKGKMAGGGMAMGGVKTAKPAMGSASKRADGIAVKGKTKGTMMAKGGKAYGGKC